MKRAPRRPSRDLKTRPTTVISCRVDFDTLEILDQAARRVGVKRQVLMARAVAREARYVLELASERIRVREVRRQQKLAVDSR